MSPRRLREPGTKDPGAPPAKRNVPEAPPAREAITELARAPAGDRAAAAGWLQAQAGNQAVGRLLGRQPAPAAPAPAPAPPTAKPDASFKDLWDRFTPLLGTKSPDLEALLPQLVAALQGEDAVTYGTRLVQYLIDMGETDLARTALNRMETEYRTRQMRLALVESGAIKGGSATPDDLPGPGIGANPVDGLVSRGRAAARSGDDALAFDLLTRAYLFLQMQLERAGPRGGATEEHRHSTQVLRHAALAEAYARMRDVLGLYPALAKERAAAGDASAAANARAAGARLRETLRSDFLLHGADAMIADAEPVETPRGAAVRIHGRSGSADVTALPGLEDPKETPKKAFQAKPMEGVHAALEGQVDLIEDLLAEPSVRRAFPSGEIDMLKLSDRLKVWKAIYETHKGSGGGLRSLMETIGRYLKAFTVHTEYNVRDWGAKSYVQEEQSGEMLTDLAGRAERDCGVYALTVAYEVYRTAKAGGLKLDFQVVTTLDHAMLVIKEGSGTFYIVSNDTVSPPLSGDVAMELGKVAGGLRGRKASAMPAMTFDLGSSIGGGGRAEYNDAAAWSKYKGAQFGLGKPGDDKEALYGQYYSDQVQLERLTLQLELALTARRPRDVDESGWLEQRAHALRPAYARLGFLWMQWATQHSWNAASAAQAMTLASGPMTLAKIGKLLMRREKIGQSLHDHDVEVLNVCKAIPPMRRELDAYEAAGRPPVF